MKTNRMKHLEKELNSMRGLDRYRMTSDDRLEAAKREKNDRMKLAE